MIVDEVMSGFGRTGQWFALNHWDVTPDILTMAYGLTCGYFPLGATIATAAIGDHFKDHFKDHFFNHAATYAGHALACATALAVIPIYQTDNLIENAETMERYLTWPNST
jgi:taurine--2-oxoglutarate transaminase